MTRKIRKRIARPRSLRTQRDVLCDVMLAAGTCETWLTLHELAQLTGYGEASVSAQLRHLRKPRYGGFAVDKRVRASFAVIRGEHGPLWEYQLRIVPRVRCGKPRPVQCGVERASLAPAFAAV